MHWWQIAIRLVWIANCYGNLKGILSAVRARHWECLHWLIPKAVGWTGLFFALLPARYGGTGMHYWVSVAGIGLVLIFYGMMIKMTDASQPRIEWFSVELPHLGRIDGAFMPLLMVISSAFAFLLFVADSIYRHHVAAGTVIILVVILLAFSLGIRLLLRQYHLTRLYDLVELAKFRPRPVQTPAQHDWIKPDTDETSS